MKFLLIASLGLFTMSSFANDKMMKEMKGKPLEEQKQMMNSHIDQKIEHLQTAKSCISAAKDEKALEKCHKDKKQAMEEKDKSKKW